jgi:hypothetical protein
LELAVEALAEPPVLPTNTLLFGAFSAAEDLTLKAFFCCPQPVTLIPASTIATAHENLISESSILCSGTSSHSTIDARTLPYGAIAYLNIKPATTGKYSQKPKESQEVSQDSGWLQRRAMKNRVSGDMQSPAHCVEFLSAWQKPPNCDPEELQSRRGRSLSIY